MMAHQSLGLDPSIDNDKAMDKDPEDYTKILNSYTQMHQPRRPSRRHSTGPDFSARDTSKSKVHVKSLEVPVERSKSSRKVVKSPPVGRNRAATAPGNITQDKQNLKPAKQNNLGRSVVRRASSDMSSDSAERPPLADGHNDEVDVLKVRNRALIHENRRLQEVVSDYERLVGIRENDLLGAKETLQSTADDDDGDGEDSVPKLKAKIRALKTKRKHEKLALIQMEKNVKTHASEIEGLQRELHRTVSELEKAEIERHADKQKINSLSNQLSAMEQHKADVQKRDNELEVTLELLQSKTERIIQLEYDIDTYKEKLQKVERRVEDMVLGSSDRFDSNPTSFQSMELISAEAEIKSLRRQNMMLKLVVEELQEARKRRSDSDIDIDSVYLKMPLDVQQGMPFSVGLGALSLADAVDDRSIDTDMVSYDTADVVMAAPMKAASDHPLMR